MSILKNWPLLVGVIISLLLGVAIALSFDTIRYPALVPPGAMVSIEPTELYKKIQNQDPATYFFYDVRTKGEFDRLHAELSSNLPIVDIYDTWPNLPRDKDTPIYLICNGGRLAGVAYEFLQLHGFRNIVHVTGGIQKWSAEGLPTVSPSLFPEDF